MIKDVGADQSEQYKVTKSRDPIRLKEEEISIFALGKFIKWDEHEGDKSSRGGKEESLDLTLTFFSMTVDDIIDKIG